MIIVRAFGLLSRSQTPFLFGHDPRVSTARFLHRPSCGAGLAINQEDLARELGVSYATVNRWENGQARPSRLARAQLDAFCDRMTAQGMLQLPVHRRGDG